MNCCGFSNNRGLFETELTIKSWSSSDRPCFSGPVYPVNRADTDFRLEPNLQLYDLQLHRIAQFGALDVQ